MKKLSYCITFLICSWIFVLSASSAQVAPINVNADGVALKGYDPVAYFTLGQSVKGQEEFMHEWQGATWLFSSKEHLAMFQKDPEKFAPQYGGY